MIVKAILIYVTVLMVQMISGRCFPSAASGAGPWGASESCLTPRFGMGINNFAASRGGVLEVVSSSPIAPTGISVYSENVIEGRLAVAGELPFLGTVAVNGALPTYGSGAVDFNCGNGNVAITREG